MTIRSKQLFALNELPKERNSGGEQDHSECWVICGDTVILGESPLLSESWWELQGFVIVAKGVGGLGPDAQIVSACVEISGQRDSAFKTWMRRFLDEKVLGQQNRALTWMPLLLQVPFGGYHTPSYREFLCWDDWLGHLSWKDVVVLALVVRQLKKNLKNLDKSCDMSPQPAIISTQHLWYVKWA